MSKAKDSVEDLRSIATVDDAQTFTAKLTFDAGIDVTGDIAVTGTVDGRDVAADGVTADAALPKSGGTMTGALNLAATNLLPISATISDTAVDVFVYDTSKDSDGGAWRKRTQATSWYNETLNTATRGSRKEFPAVAVIVATSAKVTIYDGDDPAMPMWMVLNKASVGEYGAYFEWGSFANSVVMGNGILCIGTSQSIQVTNFVSEVMRKSNDPNSYIYHINISERHVATPAATNDLATPIAHDTVNDIAMTVLPNAPIDSATGLPIPTIAVATNGGVSVIKDNGTVVDITASAGASYSGVGFISFDSNHNMIFEQDNSGRSLFYMPIPSADRTSSTSSAGPTDKKMLPFSSTNTTFPKFNGSNATIGIGGSGEDQYIYGGTGVTHYAQGPSDATSSVAYITADYNTGWMNGDIKLAALSDTDDTDVVGTELVTNGTFDTDTTGWTSLFNATLSVVSSKLRITKTDTNFFGAYQAITTVIGKKYTLTTDFSKETTNVLYLTVRTGIDPAGSSLNSSSSSVASGSLTISFTATGTTTYLHLQGGTAGYADYDNISVRLADTDRSVNANGLQVHGTITKSAVATGADLVAYSGFSASNYLKQPSLGLTTGTSDICLMGWLKQSTIGASNEVIITYGSDAATAGSSRGLFISAASGNLCWNGHGTGDVTSTTSVSNNTWTFVCGVLSSGIVYLYVNGVLVVSETPSSLASTVTDVVNLGQYVNNLVPLTSGSLALFRISATAPTAAQIKTIYEAEKPLFQENAQATLYGTSDAVTALAHDDSTNLLHVGTSSGRSVFQGLLRVDNTTTAVGAAISASNGLVVED